MNKGMEFESETDTEIIAKLVKHLYDTHKEQGISFRETVEMTVQQLVGFCELIISVMYPKKKTKKHIFGRSGVYVFTQWTIPLWPKTLYVTKRLILFRFVPMSVAYRI